MKMVEKMRCRESKGLITDVIRGSIAEEAGIQCGDILLEINGKPIEDLIQYNLLTSGENQISIKLLTKDNEYLFVEIDKEWDEDLGIIFENSIIDEIRKCRNNCIFCFINQLPSNLRETLYIKDDDYRLSFFFGNFITLTNITDQDIERIKELKISPLYVSIHTTNPALRIKITNNPRAGEIYNQLKDLVNGGIEIHCQIVLCPEINDDAELDRTIEDLSLLWPGVKSVGIVPVGLTKFRDGLYPLKKVERQKAIETIRIVEKWQQKFKKKIEHNFVFAADEFYLIAGMKLPRYKDYEEFPQLENGIGLISIFEKEFKDIKKNLPKKINLYREVNVITGILAKDFMKRITYELNKIENLKVNLFAIENNFFGKDITVTGLITGTDLIKQLEDKHLRHDIIIPSVMLKNNSDLFLDNISISEVEQRLGIDVKVSSVNAEEFMRTIMGKVNDE